MAETGTIIEYNGLGPEGTDLHIQHVQIESWTADPVKAEDQVSVLTVQHVIKGTGIVSEEDSETLASKIPAMTSRFQEPRKGFKLTIQRDVSTDSTFLDTIVDGDSTNDAPDDLNGPITKLEIKQATGGKVAVVSFEIMLWLRQSEAGVNSLADVISHRWRQRWEYDHVGLARRTVSGELVVRASADEGTYGDIATTTGNSQNPTYPNFDKGRNPDRYRLLVAPALPPGFRRERQEFVVDDTGTKMLYVIEDREFTKGLPAPLKAGEANFSWERGISSVEGMLGRKTFDIEVEGDKNTPPVQLLATAVQISKNRIVYAPSGENATAGADWIIEIKVDEVDLLSRNKVRYRVVAVGIQQDNKPFVAKTSFMLQDILRGLQVGYVPPTPYGVANIYSGIREFWSGLIPDGQTPQFPKATYEEVGIAPDAPVYVLPEGAYQQVSENLIPVSTVAGATNGGTVDGAKQNLYVRLDVREEISVDRRVVVLSPMTPEPRDVVFQFGPPKVTIRSVVVAARHNADPEKPFRPLPPGSVVVKEEFAVSKGEVDSNNNRVFVARYERVIQLLCGDYANGFSSILVGDVTFIGWWPPQQLIALPVDPRVNQILSGPGSGQSGLDDLFNPSPLGNYDLGPPDPPINTERN